MQNNPPENIHFAFKILHKIVQYTSTLQGVSHVGQNKSCQEQSRKEIGNILDGPCCCQGHLALTFNTCTNHKWWSFVNSWRRAVENRIKYNHRPRSVGTRLTRVCLSANRRVSRVKTGEFSLTENSIQCNLNLLICAQNLKSAFSKARPIFFVVFSRLRFPFTYFSF